MEGDQAENCTEQMCKKEKWGILKYRKTNTKGRNGIAQTGK